MVAAGTFTLFAFSIMLLFGTPQAQLLGNPTRSDVGVGARALGMGNNYVAVSDEASALFWNPAGIAFIHGPQIQFSFGGIRPSVHTVFRSSVMENGVDRETTRIRIGNAAFVWGGRGKLPKFSFGVAYQTPYSLDAVLDYAGAYAVGRSSVDFRNQYLALGNLDFFTGGLGMELARHVSLGVALSAVTGHAIDELWYEKRTDGTINDPYNDSYRDRIERDYVGYDARIGVMWRAPQGLTLGARVELPSVIHFRECGSESLPAGNAAPVSYAMAGRLKSYYAGAMGVAYRFPFALMDAEITGRAPHPRTHISDKQRYWRLGAGLGVEAPVIGESIVARAGYAWHEYDPNPYLVTYEGAIDPEPAPVPESIIGEHTVSVGCAYQVRDKISLDLSYSHRLCNVDTENTLLEEHRSQRILASVTAKF